MASVAALLGNRVPGVDFAWTGQAASVIGLLSARAVDEVLRQNGWRCSSSRVHNDPAGPGLAIFTYRRNGELFRLAYLIHNDDEAPRYVAVENGQPIEPGLPTYESLESALRDGPFDMIVQATFWW